MYYRIDTDMMHEMRLQGREAMVYSALLYLCKNAPYTGSLSELGNFSCCGNKMTTLRMLLALERKGLISRDKDGIKVSQNVTIASQNVTAASQNVTISKRKSNQKENIKENNEVSVCINAREETHTPASPIEEVINNLFDMNTLIPSDREKVPANTGYYKIIVTEFGYMRPKEFVDDFYLHYNAHGWPNGGNKLDLMRFWMTRYVRRKGAKKPSLSDLERAVMKTFLEQIEERLIVRLFNVVQQFEVTEQKIIFYVPEQNKKDFMAWLETLPLFTMLEAYHRTVYVK
ncbi:MAG: hypothetical protein MJZ64_01085 [Paludibacteraceae bacterium]|nr:hypothetical protein [Paludibacteraceae bacterium]